MERKRPGADLPIEKQALPLRATPEEQSCFAWCCSLAEDAAVDVCRALCLDASSTAHALHHRALRWAQHEHFPDALAHAFAAGAVWAMRQERQQP